ncbi:MAG: DUF1800 domain-containing protein, partial [Acidimicrobiia bacterium]
TTTKPAPTTTTAAATTTTTTQPAPTTTQPTTTTTQPVPPPVALTAELLAGRATFGATPGVVNRINAIGTTAWIEEQLSGKQADGKGLDDASSRLAGAKWITKSVDDLHKDMQDAWTKAADDQKGRIVEQVASEWFIEFEHADLVRAVHSERQLHEVMVQFWSNHFSTPRRIKESGTHPLRPSLIRDVIRPNALGKFSDLLLAQCQHPAMLFYLDNVGNNGKLGTMNVNYARELLELHTLGIIEGKQVYDEDDVRATAKVMSGWTATRAWSDSAIRPAEGFTAFRFDAALHNLDAVSILRDPQGLRAPQWSRPAREQGTATIEDGKDLVRFLAKHESTARYIAWKLVRHFVTDAPDVTSNDNLVDRLAKVYRDNDTAIAPVLRALLRSPEFAASSGKKFKRPTEYMVSALRVSRAATLGWDLQAGAPIVLSAQDEAYWRPVGGWGYKLGQPMNGYPTPDGWPDVRSVWLTSSGMLQRWNFAGQLGRNQLKCAGTGNTNVGVGVDAKSLLVTQWSGLDAPKTVRDAVRALAKQFGIALSDADAKAIEDAAGLSASGLLASVTDVGAGAAVGLLLCHPQFMMRG